MDRLTAFGVTMYLVAAVLTYGNAVWWIDPATNDRGEPTRAPVFTIIAPIAAAVWPLYWSARLSEPKDKP